MCIIIAWSEVAPHTRATDARLIAACVVFVFVTHNAKGFDGSLLLN